MVRISRKRLIELQRDALRTHALEDEIRGHRHRKAVVVAAARVAELGLAERTAVAHLVEDPPLTADGEMHEEAFGAAVDAAVWALREQQLAALGIGTDSTPGGQG